MPDRDRDLIKDRRADFLAEWILYLRDQKDDVTVFDEFDYEDDPDMTVEESVWLGDLIREADIFD